MRAECRGFSENLLSKIKIESFEKFDRYLLDDNLFLMWNRLFKKLVLLQLFKVLLEKFHFLCSYLKCQLILHHKQKQIR